jgi:hypothetical protein
MSPARGRNIATRPSVATLSIPATAGPNTQNPEVSECAGASAISMSTAWATVVAPVADGTQSGLAQGLRHAFPKGVEAVD